MMLDFFKRGEKKHKESEEVKSPVLDEDDEQFLKRITSEETPPPLPTRPIVILNNGPETKGEQAADPALEGADKVPLPTSPPAVPEDRNKGKEKSSPTEKKGTKDEKKKKDYWGYLPSIHLKGKSKSKEETADTLAAAAAVVKAGGAVDGSEAKKEEEDLSAILDQLNLAAVNNRVFSFSKESQELMDKFKLVLKDLVNGVPTAYHDLESLLKNSNSQLESMFESLPPFLKNLVKSLPAKVSATLAPELLAATSEKPGADGKLLSAEVGKQAKRAKVPSLKRLLSQQGAVTAMLRSIMNFLKLRFPAFMTGTNVLLSLALFILLFVLWYCHKRGRETRLEKERLAAGDASESEMEASSASDMEDSRVFNPPERPHTGSPSSDGPSTAIPNLPSVRDLPDPKPISSPAQSPGTVKD